MNKKLYPCQIPGCTNESSIRSRVKSGEHKGSSACPSCRQKYSVAIEKVVRQIPKVTVKNKYKRKLEREGLPKFFGDKVLQLTMNPFCENCGGRINAAYLPFHNTAHVLSKRKYKSVMANPNNVLFLCAGKDALNNCHEKFDNDLVGRESMPVFKKALERYLLFKDETQEWGKERLMLETALGL